MAKRNRTEDPWRQLTWDDLEAWVGSRSLQRGRTYQRSGRVGQLARTADGALLAWVRGTYRYATRVALEDEDGVAGLASICTCPIGGDCKHAVAVVVDYLEALKDGRDVPTAGADDPRLQSLEEGGEADEYGEDEFEPGDDEEWDEEEPPAAAVRLHRETRPAADSERRTDVRSYLEGLSSEELVAYVLGLAADYPEIKRDLKSRAALAGGRVGDLVRDARKEIRRLTAVPAWANHWDGGGSVPDYAGLKRLFERLSGMSQADALLDLGTLLLERGTEQVGQSDDEGETAGEIGGCLDVVFRAVPASSKTDAKKILYALDMVLQDEYDLCQGAGVVLDRDWSPQVWSEVADELARRLGEVPKSNDDDYTGRYRRDHLSGWLIRALEQSGREAEVLPVMEAEARVTGSYLRLVDALLAKKRTDEARRWAVEGIERVGRQWPGIANQLRQRLRQMAADKKDWATVAAMQAEEFFKWPSAGSLHQLESAAEKAGCREAVRAAALHFLETGQRPAPAASPAPLSPKPRRGGKTRRPAAGSSGAPSWPLPELLPELREEETRPRPPHGGPHFNVLIDLALEEHRPDDVLRWYDACRAGGGRRYGSHAGSGYDGRVADAIAETHPDRAAELYRKIVAAYVAQTSPSAYESALPYLRKLRTLLQRVGRPAEWTGYLRHLRETERRKRRFMEVLDRLESRPIVDG